jgi:hypothetical protein
VLFVALVSIIFPAGTFLTRHITPPGVSIWIYVAEAFALGGLICRYLGSFIPAKLTQGGPGNRALFHVLPLICAEVSFGLWHPGYKYYLGPGVAAGFTAATAFRYARRWQTARATPKKERDAALPPESHASTFTNVGMTIVDLGGSIMFATIALIIGAQLSTALEPVLERAAAPFPGGHLRIAGHLVVAHVAVSLCGLVFTVAVTSGFLRALTYGFEDWKMPRTGQYFWACLPYVIALAWSVRQPGLAFGCASTLALLIALGIWTDRPPNDAFSKVKVASVLWRSRLGQQVRIQGTQSHGS